MALDVGGHPDAAVGDDDLHISAGGRSRSGPAGPPPTTTLDVPIASRPPPGMASRALTARLTSTCSSWPGSARTLPSSGFRLDGHGDVFSDDTRQEPPQVGDQDVDIDNRRFNRLPAREC